MFYKLLLPSYLQISVTVRANQLAGLGSKCGGHFMPEDAGTEEMRKAMRRIQAKKRFEQIGTSDNAECVQDNIWTEGQTEFTDS